MENKKWVLAGLFIWLGFYIKIFLVVCFCLFILYIPSFEFSINILKPGKHLKEWKYFLRGTVGAILLGILSALFPLIFIDFSQLTWLYKEWWKLLKTDDSISFGISVMGMMNTWFGWHEKNIWVELPSLLIVLFPLLFYSTRNSRIGRELFLSSLMIWMVIFNHRGESPTYIIAMTGVAIWWINTLQLRKLTIQDGRLFFNKIDRYFDLSLLIFAIVLTSLSPTDFFPKFLRDEFVVKFSLKALPCFFVWVRIIFLLTKIHYLNKPHY